MEPAGRDCWHRGHMALTGLGRGGNCAGPVDNDCGIGGGAAAATAGAGGIIGGVVGNPEAFGCLEKEMAFKHREESKDANQKLRMHTSLKRLWD